MALSEHQNTMPLSSDIMLAMASLGESCLMYVYYGGVGVSLIFSKFFCSKNFVPGASVSLK